MSAWQFAAACAVGAPGLVLGALLVSRRQWVVGALLLLLGLLPFSLLAPDPELSGPPPQGLGLALAVASVAGWVWFYLPPALLAAYLPDGRLGRGWWVLPVGWLIFLRVLPCSGRPRPRHVRPRAGPDPGQSPGHGVAVGQRPARCRLPPPVAGPSGGFGGSGRRPLPPRPHPRTSAAEVVPAEHAAASRRARGDLGDLPADRCRRHRRGRRVAARLPHCSDRRGNRRAASRPAGRGCAGEPLGRLPLLDRGSGGSVRGAHGGSRGDAGSRVGARCGAGDSGLCGGVRVAEAARAVAGRRQVRQGSSRCPHRARPFPRRHS